MQFKLGSKKQQGAFLVIALILMMILSGLGVAFMSSAFTSNRVSLNYSQYAEAKIRALSLAGYAKRILETYADGVYSGPSTCASSGTCNVIDNTFPNNGKPVLAWTGGLGNPTFLRGSESNAWWNTNAFAYEASFAGTGNARIIVTRLGVNASAPYQNTYRVVGYSTDSSGTVVKSTYQLFHVWKGYPAAPGNGTCAGGCGYNQCCSASTVCASDKTSCEGGSATYVPPGWTCTSWFVTGKTFGSAACANPVCPPGAVTCP